MNLEKRINILVQLGEQITPENPILETAIRRSAIQNLWFTAENQWLALNEIKDNFLNKEKLNSWFDAYKTGYTEPENPKKIAQIPAGNIPLVGFHDFFCVFVAGHHSLIKLSEKDSFLLPAIVHIMKEIDTEVADYVHFIEGKMKNFDAVIATGSNNSARYFEAYFSKFPNIIRKNRNAIAVLRGDETIAEIEALGDDVFRYFGLGCRNVSKMYVPQGYNFDTLLETWHEKFKYLVLHEPYKNNFDYQFAILILNKVKYYSNGCVLMYENPTIASQISVLHVQFYTDLATVTAEIETQHDDIQCVVSNTPLPNIATFHFGEAQKPSLADYPDGVDVMNFLLKI